jgi:hypothetical protein
MGGARVPARTADDRHRCAGVLQEVHQRRGRQRVDGLDGRPDRGTVQRLGLLAEHVLGKDEDDRARAP